MLPIGIPLFSDIGKRQRMSAATAAEGKLRKGFSRVKSDGGPSVTNLGTERPRARQLVVASFGKKAPRSGIFMPVILKAEHCSFIIKRMALIR